VNINVDVDMRRGFGEADERLRVFYFLCIL